MSKNKSKALESIMEVQRMAEFARASLENGDHDKFQVRMSQVAKQFAEAGIAFADYQREPKAIDDKPLTKEEKDTIK